jgi:hypothetical protein
VQVGCPRSANNRHQRPNPPAPGASISACERRSNPPPKSRGWSPAPKVVAAVRPPLLKALGIAIIPASAPDFFTEDTPTAVLVRQVLGAIAQFEKASSVAKRKREREGRCEARKPLETRPEVVELARKLRRRKPKAGQLSFREVAKALAARGYALSSSTRPCCIDQPREQPSY